MISGLKRIGLASCAIVLGVAAASGQSLRGKVIVPSVETPERIEVRLEKTDGQVIMRSYTDKEGNFDMRGMRAGAYEIVVRVEGYAESRLRIEVLPPINGATIVNIPLERPEPKIVMAP